MLVVSWFNGLYEVIILWNQGRFPSALRPRKAQTRAPWAFGYQGAGAKGPRCNTAIGSSVGTSLIIYSVKPGIVDYLVYHDNQIFPLQAGCIPMISHVNTNIKPQKKLQGNPKKIHEKPSKTHGFSMFLQDSHGLSKQQSPRSHLWRRLRQQFPQGWHHHTLRNMTWATAKRFLGIDQWLIPKFDPGTFMGKLMIKYDQRPQKWGKLNAENHGIW